ncbi:MAG: ferrous iron transport protein B [Corynebacterium sp.]|nr:ferrous iron transport protein B [Corynebacterium sp.]
MIGTPNAGKSTLYNALTGAKARMGNWPGTSVETSRGAWVTNDATYDVIDFPGTYSLDPLSPDEQLTRELLIDTKASERPDVVVVVTDATALARSLYMVAQLAEHPQRLVLALTKLDVAANQGVHVDPKALSQALGIPVVALNPRHSKHAPELASAVAEVLASPPRKFRRRESSDPLAAADSRFSWVDAATKAATTTTSTPPSWSQRIDRLALHPVLGPVLFLVVMWIVFELTTTVAAPLQDGLDTFFNGPLTDWTQAGLTALGLNNQVLDGFILGGLIAGVGTVLTFAPLMAIMFLILAVLEDSGYMARAAVVTNRLMQTIGLPGKAFIPLIVGFGCNVPAISATRVLGQQRQRLLTALLIPFTSCSARLTVFVMLGATFFPDHAGTVVFVMYLISIALVILVGFLVKNTLWRTIGREPLIIDLPTYQLPGVRLACSVMWIRLKGFLQTAGGIIVITVTVVFFMQSIPAVSGYSFADEDLPVEDSVYGVTADFVSPVFEPAGFGSWSITGTLITGFIAKETVISSWAQTYDLEDPSDEDPEDQGTSPLANAVRADFEEASGGHQIAAVWAFMMFFLAYTPCVATLAAQRREIGLRWTLYGVVLQVATAWILAVLTFQILRVWF